MEIPRCQHMEASPKKRQKCVFTPCFEANCQLPQLEGRTVGNHLNHPSCDRIQPVKCHMQHNAQQKTMKQFLFTLYGLNMVMCQSHTHNNKKKVHQHPIWQLATLSYMQGGSHNCHPHFRMWFPWLPGYFQHPSTRPKLQRVRHSAASEASSGDRKWDRDHFVEAPFPTHQPGQRWWKHP